ncbi:hypothetical protein [Hyalangium gracile]|uniref:hypothetical protein n=1 Tax=Hyalangium gracile TaxID=394092 RepID=UPI001CCF1312|nr:hypothetical protein [Hyalangium gracile]
MTDSNLGGMGYGLAGARCAIHPEQSATRTCTRCGSFMCSMCAEGGAQTLCPACQQRLGMEYRFPLDRDNWTFSALWDYCFEIFKRDWLMLGVAMLAFFGILFAVQLVGGLLPTIGEALDNTALSVLFTIISTVLQQAVQGILGLGLMRMVFDVLNGNKLDIGRLFSQVHKTGTYLLAMLIVVLMVGVPIGALAGIVAGLGYAIGWDAALPIAIGVGVLALFPLIYFTIPLYLLQAEIAYNDEEPSATQMIRNCYAYARGERLSIMGVSLVGGLVAMLGVMACCVGVLPASGLTYLLLGGLYLALRNGADVERGS